MFCLAVLILWLPAVVQACCPTLGFLSSVFPSALRGIMGLWDSTTGLLTKACMSWASSCVPLRA